MGLEPHGQTKFFIQGPLCSGSLWLCTTICYYLPWVDWVQFSSFCVMSLMQLQSEGSARGDSRDSSLTWLATNAKCWSGAQLRLSPRTPAYVFSTWPPLLSTWRLSHDRKQSKNKDPKKQEQKLLGQSGTKLGLLCYFCHILLEQSQGLLRFKGMPKLMPHLDEGVTS